MLHRLMDGTRFGIYDDFCEGADSLRWSFVAPDVGSWSVSTGANGYASLFPSDGTVADNDEFYLNSAGIFLLKAKRPLYAAVRLQFVDAIALSANVIFGFTDSGGENALIDNGGGPRQAGSGCCLYKLDGGAQWRAQTRDAFDFQDAVSLEPAGSLTRTETVDGVITNTTPWEFLEILIDDPAPPYQVRDRVMVATFRVNGRPLTDGAGAPVRHELSILNVTEWILYVGIKNGSANAELLSVDLLHADQVRD